MRADFKAGRLRKKDAKELTVESETPQLSLDFRRLSLENALQVWELADDAERKELRSLLAKERKDDRDPGNG